MNIVTVVITVIVINSKQHFQRGQASTELEINKLNDWH